MFDVTGFIPSIIYNKIPHEKYENLFAKGTNINIDITQGANLTSLSAITLGNGTWEIDELEDNCNLFPEYSEGDVISLDTLVKVLSKPVNQSYHIFSFNALGKVKYGIKDAKRKIKDKINWFTDDLKEDEAYNFINKHYPNPTIYAFELYKKQDGKIYKFLFSSRGKYYILCILRNGNTLRFVDDDDYEDTPIYSTKDSNEAVEVYKHYPNIDEIETENDVEDDTDDVDDGYEFTREELNNALQTIEQFNVVELIDFETIKDKAYKHEDYPTALGLVAASDSKYLYIGWMKFFSDEGVINMSDGNFLQIPDEKSVEFYVNAIIKQYHEQGGKKNNFKMAEQKVKEEVASSKKNKKKSKYNGKNVTGYETGYLSPMVSNVLNYDD